MRKVILLLSVFAIPAALPAQEKELVYGTFRGSNLINVQTTEVLMPSSFDFTIKHRFGAIGFDSTAWQQFLGLDLPANIRFGFAIPLGERLYVGIGRTKTGKTVDLEAKYQFLRQTEDNSIPVTAAFYFSPAIRTEKFPRVPEYAFFGDSITPFEYKFSHRLMYNTQLIVSRKFSDKFSLLISPMFIYKNLVSPDQRNHTAAVSLGGVYKYGSSSSIIFEYTHRFDNLPQWDAYPVSLAWEFGTVGHVFQVVISASSELIEHDLNTKDSFNYFKGKFALGFNIRRTTWIQKKEE